MTSITFPRFNITETLTKKARCNILPLLFNKKYSLRFSEKKRKENSLNSSLKIDNRLFSSMQIQAHKTLGSSPGGRGVLPYTVYTGMIHWTGHGFWPLCPL